MTQSAPANTPGDAINSPECLNRAQEHCHVPRGKKIGTINLRFDKEFAQAVETLQDIYPDVSKSELIREAVIEKAKRDAQQRTKRPEPKP